MPRKPGNPNGINRRLELPSYERLHEIYRYDRTTGKLFSRIGSKMRPAGGEIGFVAPNGYLRTDVDEQRMLVHRIIWKMVTGCEPPRVVDHKDGNRRNNRFENLREADDHRNGANAAAHADAATPLKGVCKSPTPGRWYAQICVRRERIHLGTFSTPEAAHAAYVDAAKQYFGEFARAA